jgi:hypothetical protein
MKRVLITASLMMGSSLRSRNKKALSAGSRKAIKSRTLWSRWAVLHEERCFRQRSLAAWVKMILSVRS